jgi:hypothetical protein
LLPWANVIKLFYTPIYSHFMVITIAAKHFNNRIIVLPWNV